jgi:hypothetical protein
MEYNDHDRPHNKVSVLEVRVHSCFGKLRKTSAARSRLNRDFPTHTSRKFQEDEEKTIQNKKRKV